MIMSAPDRGKDILSCREPCRHVPGDEGDYKETHHRPENQHRIHHRGDWTTGEHDRVCRKELQDHREKPKADNGAEGKDEQGLEQVRPDDDRAVDPDRFQDPNLLPPVDRVDEDHDEDDHDGDHQAHHRADEVDDVEGADDLVQEIGRLLLPGPYLLLYPKCHQGSSHRILVPGLLGPDEHLVCLVLKPVHRLVLVLGDEGIRVDIIGIGIDDPLDTVLPGHPVVVGDLDHLPHVHPAKRGDHVLSLIVVPCQPVTDHDLIGIAIRQVLPAGDFCRDLQHPPVIIRVDRIQERGHLVSLVDDRRPAHILGGDSRHTGDPFNLPLELVSALDVHLVFFRFDHQVAITVVDRLLVEQHRHPGDDGGEEDQVHKHHPDNEDREVQGTFISPDNRPLRKEEGDL